MPHFQIFGLLGARSSAAALCDIIKGALGADLQQSEAGQSVFGTDFSARLQIPLTGRRHILLLDY